MPAFLGAEGAGTSTPGGRGGAVIEVTNLNDSGAGSLRACVEATGPRTCVFRVSGTIALASTLVVANGFLTVAGQTAPGGGVQITGKTFVDDLVRVNANDVVVRYVKIRQGYNGAATWGGAGISVEDSTSHLVLDHVTIAWSVFKNVSVWGNNAAPHDITFSWNLFAEPLWPANGAVNMNVGSLTTDIADAMTDIDLHHNVFTGQNHRAPLLGNRSGRLVNNLVYNWRYYPTRLKGLWDVVGNYYKAGSFTNGVVPTHEIQMYTSGEANSTTLAPSVYLGGNVGPHDGFDPSADDWSSLTALSVDQSREEASSPVPGEYRRGSPLATPDATAPIAVGPATDLPRTMLPFVGASQRLDCEGAWVSNRDAADARIVQDVLDGTGPAAPISSEAEVGGHPALDPGTPCADADHDGMPDEFEIARGLDPKDASDGNAATLSPPVTNLEVYLNGHTRAASPL